MNFLLFITYLISGTTFAEKIPVKTMMLTYKASYYFCIEQTSTNFAICEAKYNTDTQTHSCPNFHTCSAKDDGGIITINPNRIVFIPNVSSSSSSLAPDNIVLIKAGSSLLICSSNSNNYKISRRKCRKDYNFEIKSSTLTLFEPK